MISRRHVSRASIVFASLLASLMGAATGCSSSDLAPGPSSEAVGHTAEAVDSFCTSSQPLNPSTDFVRPSLDWSDLVPAPLAFADVNTDIACTIPISTDPVNPLDHVFCFVPRGNPSNPFADASMTYDTGYGGATCKGRNGTDCTGLPIYQLSPRAVAILKHTEVAYRPGGGTYGVYVLLADGRVMVTNGDSDKFYTGTHFKQYSLFISPVSSTGQTLSIKKIVWINEDGMGRNDPAVTPYLVALTYNNQLYYTTYSGGPWVPYLSDVRDVSHLPGRGDTVLFMNGQVEYGAFSNPGWAWRGMLPNAPNGSMIVAVGGMYALTNDGCHGACVYSNSTFCAGDDTRILRFDWPRWKWEPYVARLSEQNSSHTASYYPISAGYTCDGCSPQISESIIDPHGFGSNTVPLSNPVGPFVHDASSSRMQFYSPQSAALTYPLAVCTGYLCSNSCGERPDGTPCEFDQSNGGAPRVCSAGQCQACGGTNPMRCPGQYTMNRIWDPGNTVLNTLCYTTTQFAGTMVSKCATMPSTCGFLYCVGEAHP